MLRSLAPAAADDHAHRQWHAVTAISDIVALCRRVEQLFEAQQREIDSLVRHDRPRAHHCGADGDAGQPVFRDRHFDHAIGTIFVDQALGGAEYAAGISDAFTDQIGIVALPQRYRQRLADRFGGS